MDNYTSALKSSIKYQMVTFAVTVICLIIGQRYRRRQTRSGRGRAAADETARLLDSDNEEDSFVADRDRPQAGSSNSPEEQTVPIEDIMRRRPTPNGTDPGPSSGVGGAAAARGGRRRYRCDTEHREYCSDLINCYDIPPAEDAMEAQAGERAGRCLRRDEDESQALQHMMLLVLLSISMFIGMVLIMYHTFGAMCKEKDALTLKVAHPSFFLILLRHRALHLDAGHGHDDRHLP